MQSAYSVYVALCVIVNATLFRKVLDSHLGYIHILMLTGQPCNWEDLAPEANL